MSIGERLNAIEARLQYLEEIELVRQSIALYCKAMDARDLPTMASLFSHDAVLTVVPWSVDLRGHRAIVEFYGEYFKSDWKDPRHYYANEIIEREGDGYRAFSYFHEVLERGSDSFVGWGTWEDTLVCEDGIWKFGKKHITVMALTSIDRGWARPDRIVNL